MTQPPVTQAFLDAEQYSPGSIAAYETVYGTDFVSPGGAAMAGELARRLAPPRGSRVLDAGCGLGGGAFLLAREFGVQVHGIDLSHNMIGEARRRCAGHGLHSQVSFEQGDILDLQRPGAYQAIYSRDVFLHVHDKPRLLQVLQASLAPGGRLLFTDYCCGPTPWRADFTAYVASRNYALHTLAQYLGLLRDAGFSDVCGTDLSARFIEILRTELAHIETAPLDPPSRAALAASWRAKLTRSADGDQRWCLLEARRAD